MISWIEFVMKFKLEVKENLTSQIERLQECLDNVEFKIDNYYDLCEPITREMMQQWNEKLDNM